MRSRTSLLAGASGIISVLTIAGFGELFAVLLSARSGPLITTATAVARGIPPTLQEWGIHTFGTADKAVFAVFMGLVMLVIAALAGYLQWRRRGIGVIMVAAFAVVGMVLSAAASDFAGVLATALATLLGVWVLVVLIRRLKRWDLRRDTTTPSDPLPSARHPARREFIGFAAASTAAAVLAGAATAFLAASTHTVDAARRTVVLPKPAPTPTPAQTPMHPSASPTAPETQLGIKGIAPLITPASDFYRIDTAFVVPQVDPKTWSLKVTGMVDHEFTLSFDELLKSELIERAVTLTCVSNTVGGDLIGNATWLGYPLAQVMQRAKPQAKADMVLSRSVDGFTAGTPLRALTDGRDAMLAVAMNGVPLPAEHGFPVRMVVPGLYGYVSATKWVSELKLTRFDREFAYWTARGWSEMGPVKLASRIDTPRGGSTVSAGRVMVGGVAWEQHVGIKAVEVKVDGGPWQEAELAAAISADTWCQWGFAWNAEPGSHQLQVRAIDMLGMVQIENPSPPIPNGATGYHTINVMVS